MIMLKRQECQSLMIGENNKEFTMKTEIWKYTVMCKDGEKWECVFDFEVSKERVIAEFESAT